MKKRKNNISTILLALLFLAGMSLVLYPTFSDYWNSYHQTQAISSYAEQVADLNAETYAEVWTAAEEYNQTLLERTNAFFLTDEQRERYKKNLDVTGLGILGYIEIPEINCSLPIYHGTEESALQIAVGHLEWSSLPVGGENSHCVLSGHRGLPSAKLFSDLDKLEEGDYFILRVLDEVLTYEVDQIRIVEPQEVDTLLVVEGEDLCTLVTCTPYAINTHRLLVRGHRVENIEESGAIRVTADATQIKPLLVASLSALPIILLLTISLFLPGRKKKIWSVNEDGEP